MWQYFFYIHSQYYLGYFKCISHSIVCPAMCVLQCLGKTVEGSGLDKEWQEAHLYDSITVTQIINGNHHNKGLEARQITLQVLFNIWLSAFLDDHPVV